MAEITGIKIGKEFCGVTVASKPKVVVAKFHRGWLVQSENGRTKECGDEECIIGVLMDILRDEQLIDQIIQKLGL